MNTLEAREDTLFNRTFRDSDGNIVIAQKPNLPLLVGLTATLSNLLLTSGNLHSGLDALAFGSLFTWAWQELFQGVNYFRRTSGSNDKTVRLWDLQGQPIGQPFQGHASRVTSVAFSPDGKTIASGSKDNTILLWHGNWEGWLQVACNRLRYHPVLQNPESSSEPLVAAVARQTCEEQVWGKLNFGSR